MNIIKKIKNYYLEKDIDSACNEIDQFFFATEEYVWSLNIPLRQAYIDFLYLDASKEFNTEFFNTLLCYFKDESAPFLKNSNHNKTREEVKRFIRRHSIRKLNKISSAELLLLKLQVLK